MVSLTSRPTQTTQSLVRERTGSPSNIWFPGHTQLLNPNGSSIGAAVFAGLTSVTDRLTDRPTDHATRSVTMGRMYVRSIAMRRNNA